MNRLYASRRWSALIFGLASAMAATAATAPAVTPLPLCPTGSHPAGKAPPAGLEWHCETADAVAEGPWLRWYDNGQLLSEGHMKNGREHGRQRGWWPNGQLMFEGISVDGNRYQGFKYWSFDGSPTDLGIKPEVVVQPAEKQPAGLHTEPPQKNNVK